MFANVQLESQRSKVIGSVQASAFIQREIVIHVAHVTVRHERPSVDNPQQQVDGGKAKQRSPNSFVQFVCARVEDYPPIVLAFGDIEILN